MFGKQNNLVTTPNALPRTTRVDEVVSITSGKAGKIIPVAYVPLLREDSLGSGTMRVNYQMAETAELLMNNVNIRTQAWLVPFLAFDRFKGMDSLNRAYHKEPEEPGGDVIPFIEEMNMPAHGASEIYTSLGLHYRPGQKVNSAVVQAYNQIVNHRRRMASGKLPLREENDQTLAEAFWHRTQMGMVKPDFDQAMIYGEVDLNVVSQDLAVKGIGHVTNSGNPTASNSVRYTGGTAAETGQTGWKTEKDAQAVADARLFLRQDPDNPGFPGVWADMSDAVISVSLANIDAARKSRAFAQLRTKFQGHSDDYIIDLLMSGIRIPDQALKQPMLLANQETIFGYSRRWASDGENLDKSATTGQSFTDLRLALPPINTGGVVMITAEITPDQLFERQRDYFFTETDQAKWPEYVRDSLDPEPVEIKLNEEVDTDHSAPTETFGYAPLNHRWMRQAPKVGGKFYRPVVDEEFDEDRQRIWAVEETDPTLSASFYLATEMHQKVFMDTEADPFEISSQGTFLISGHTFFGPGLREASDNYQRIQEQMDYERIDKPDGGVPFQAAKGDKNAPGKTEEKAAKE